VITLASKRENEEAFWTGLVNGFGPLGFSTNYFYDVDQDFEDKWYQEEMSLTHTDVPGKNTDLQFSYNLGYATSAVGFGMAMYGVGVYAGAQAGLMVTFAVTVLEGIASIGSSLFPLVKYGARTVPVLALFYLLLSAGEASKPRRNFDERREHMQNL